MQHEPIQFFPVQVPRSQIVSAARAYAGVPYSTHRNYLLRGEDGALDLERSSLNCFGLLLVVARDCGLLDASFDLNRARWRSGQTVDEALWELLKTNATQIKKSASRAGDVLLMWFRDVDASVESPHHVAIQSDATPGPNGRRGRLIHAVESDASLEGFVIEQDVDTLERPRIHSVWRLNAVRD